MINDIKVLLVILSLILVIDVVLLIAKIPCRHIDIGLCFRIYYYPFRKCGRICQRRIKMDGATNVQRLAAFANQQHTLEKELPIGTYSITTHAAILRRIEACKTITVNQCRKAYKRSLNANYKALTGTESNHNKKVQFYKLRITKK